MKKQSWLTLALLSFITPACDFDEFYVTEENLAFGNDCPNLNTINGYDCTEKSCLIGEEKYDYSRNYKLKKCPAAYPTCINKHQCIKISDMESCSHEDGSITPHGSFRCFSEGTGIIKLCNDGKWDNIDECEGGCNAKQTDCSDKLNPCIGDDNKTYADTISHCFTEGETSTVRTCSNGEWNDDEICIDLSCNAQNVACGQCKNGDKKYENRMVKTTDGETQEICQSITCINGTWVVDEESTCHDSDSSSNSSCVFDDGGNAQCGNCLNGSSQCRDDNGKGIIEICENGKWKENKQCSYNGVSLGCLDDTTCKECNDDQFIYHNQQDASDGNKLVCKKYACQAGKWENVQTGLKEVSGYECISACDDHAEDHCSCKEEPCTCDENAKRCIDLKSSDSTKEIGQYQTCHKNVWSEYTKCQNDNSCVSTLECGECQNGDTKCENNDQNVGIIYQCESGKWIAHPPCNNNVSCNADKTDCGECKSGKSKYEDLPDNTCQQYNCNNGKWDKADLCEDKVSCFKTSNTTQPSKCGDCINYTFKKGNTPNDFYMCLNGKYEQHNCVYQLLITYSHKVEEIGSFLVCDQGINITHDYDNLECINEIENGVNIGYQLTQKNKIDKKCGDNVSCTITGVGASECGVCQDGKTRCRTTQMQQTCLNGQWGFDQTCNCTGEGVCELEQE